MQLLDGKLVSAHIKEEIKKQVQELTCAGKRAPHLVAILVGENPASQAYVASKVKNCGELGFESTLVKYDTGKRPLSIENDLFPTMLKAGEDLRVISTVDEFIDIGTEETLSLAEDFIKRNFKKL
jgi:methylenetetrahydrofolate dehydrogenase (NADP+)/methenyltetrahydrofolate cyclohydrolase